MTSSTSRTERAAIALWFSVGVVVWNGLYDLLIVRGVNEYLLRSALFEAGRGAHVPMATIMDEAVTEAVWLSTFWAGVIVLCGLVTVRICQSSVSRQSPVAD